MVGERETLEGRIRSACVTASWRDAATIALKGYGAELLGYLVALTRNETDAREAFSTFAEDMWKSLPKFAWQSSFRTWAYTLARNAFSRLRRGAFRRRAVPLDDAPVEALVEQTRSRTAEFLQTEAKDRLSEVRAKLDPDDQTLLILRLNRGLSYPEIAQVLAGEETDLGSEELARRTAALRKRFTRLKATIRELVRGVPGDPDGA